MGNKKNTTVYILCIMALIVTVIIPIKKFIVFFHTINIANLEEWKVDSLFESNDLRRYRIADIILFPSIESRAKGEYTLCVTAYSLSKEASVDILGFALSEKGVEKTSIENQNKAIHFSFHENAKNSGVYFNRKDVSTFPLDNSILRSGNELILSVEVEVSANNKYRSIVDYSFIVSGFYSFLFPL